MFAELREQLALSSLSHKVLLQKVFNLLVQIPIMEHPTISLLLSVGCYQNKRNILKSINPGVLLFKIL